MNNSPFNISFGEKPNKKGDSRRFNRGKLVFSLPRFKGFVSFQYKLIED